MKISYAITVCNEFLEIQKLVPFLLENKRPQDEIVILYDQKNGDEEIALWLKTFNKLPNVQFWRGYFENDFAEWKNSLNKYCTGDYIFQIDADEMPSLNLVQSLPEILETNQVDLIRVARVNTVEGLTQEHVQKWGWQVNEQGWVNYPDYQWRIYRNDPRIRWWGHVHEKIIGHGTFAELPMDESFSLYHLKTIEKQEKQNAYYNQL